ncbi:MAG: hypothetical protein WDN28_09420 [Chthoniobacter sp.]
MPEVTVCWKPNGEPMATAICPTRIVPESASRTCWRFRRVDAQHREIRVGIFADELRGKHAGVMEP